MCIRDSLLPCQARELFWAGAGPDVLGLEWPTLRRDAEHCFANAARADPSAAPSLGVQPLPRGRPQQWTADHYRPTFEDLGLHIVPQMEERDYHGTTLKCVFVNGVDAANVQHDPTPHPGRGGAARRRAAGAGRGCTLGC